MVGKKIHELRVVDLRAQLEKRGLDIKGNKAALVEKLRKAMEEEGISPDADIIDGGESNNSSMTKEELKEESDLGEENEPNEAGDVPQTEEISIKVESAEESTNDNHDTKAISSSNDDDDVQIKEEEEQEGIEEEVAKTFGDSLMETIATIELEKKENENAITTTTTDDDHEELHLTVGEEEDKFIIEGGVDSNTNTGTDEVKVEEKNGESEEQTEIIESSTKEDEEEAEPCSTSDTKAEVDDDVEDISEDTQDDSKEGKCSEKNEEAGKNNLKSKDDERNTLLVTGLTSLISATEIKAEFKKQGKIGGVKIISNAKDPEGSRFALVSVCSSEDAQNCISTLDGTPLRGRIIHVEKAREDMLSADWVKKESHRERDSKKKDSSSSKRSSPNSSIVSGTPGNGNNESTNKPTEKTKSESSSRKKSNEQVISPTEQKNVESNKTTANSSSESKKKEKDSSSSRNTQSASKTTDRRSNAERRESYRSRGSLSGASRTIQRRPIRDSRPVFVSRNSRHHEESRRGGDQYRRFHDSRGRRGHHQTSYIRRSRSPVERIPFRRGSDDRRVNRQDEQLTFEVIYDARQREKMRETERERREAERRRLEEEERQRLLDEEFRRLAKERERIEQEKAELKRQKERMIMEEREKQKQEQAEIEREKAALLAQKAKGKRPYPDDGYGSVGHYSKKTTLDDRHNSRHSSSFLDLRSESDKHRSYRKDDHSRYSEIDSQSSPIRTTIRSAPTRDRRSPSWERGDHHKSRDSRDSRGTDRHSSRHDKDHGKSRDDHKTSSTSSVGSSATASSGRIPYDSASQFSSAISVPRLTSSSKALDTYLSGTSRWPSSIYSGDTHLTTMNPIRNETWQPTARDTSWLSERVGTRPMTEMPDRWSSTNTGTSSGRLGLPIAPPPPVFSNATSNLGLGSSISGGSFNSSLYSSPYDYKMPSISSHRR